MRRMYFNTSTVYQDTRILAVEWFICTVVGGTGGYIQYWEYCSTVGECTVVQEYQE